MNGTQGGGTEGGGPPSAGPLRAVEVGIVSAQPQVLEDFYRDAFGFTEELAFVVEAGRVCKMVSGGARLKVYTPAAPPQPSLGEPLGAREGVSYFALHVVELEATVERAVDCGATIVIPPNSHRPGASAAVIRDPQGNVIELLYNQHPA